MALFSFQLRFKSIIIYNFGNLPLACFWHSYSDLLIRYRTWAVKSGTWERKTIHVRSYETRKTEKSSQMKEKQSKNEREREREQQLLSCKSPDTGGVTAAWINIPPSLPFFLFVSVFLYGSLTHAQVKSQALSLQDEKFCAERPNFSIYRAVARNSSVTGQKIKKRCYFVWEKWQLGNVFYLKIILCILCFEKVKKNVSVLQEMDTLLLDLNLELTPLNEMQFWKKASKYFKIWIFYFLFLKKKE